MWLIFSQTRFLCHRLFCRQIAYLLIACRSITASHALDNGEDSFYDRGDDRTVPIQYLPIVVPSNEITFIRLPHAYGQQSHAHVKIGDFESYRECFKSKLWKPVSSGLSARPSFVPFWRRKRLWWDTRGMRIEYKTRYQL